MRNNINLFLLSRKSFVLTTLGFTWVAFALGALAWWGPIFLQKAYAYVNNDETEETKAK
jgi:hypothetical protein